MKTQLLKIWFVIPLVALLWANQAVSSTITSIGLPVAGGPGNTTDVGTYNNVTGEITYFIPLKQAAEGTYGDTATTPPCANGIGTCRDSGDGNGYNGADSLFMHIYFPLLGPEAVDAELVIHFDDLDLTPINDPNTGEVEFYESMTFAYWDTDKAGGADYQQVGGVIKNVDDLTDTDFPNATTDPDPLSDPDTDDPFDWTLDLAAMGLLDDLNDSRIAHSGIWFLLGFGSSFCDSNPVQNPDVGDDVCTIHGKNTAEFINATLHVSPVPLPSAVWLFGSALLGFIGMSRRTRV